MPNWDPQNLSQHHQKRITADAGCFESLIGINGRTATEAEYEQRSQQAVATAWAEYEGECRNVAQQGYYPVAAYFVDDALVVGITDIGRTEFRTCYHEHFSKKHGQVPMQGASIGQRRLRYCQKLQWDEQGKMVINLKRIRGV